MIQPFFILQSSLETNDNETVCYCNHLTDFGGGGPVAAANDIDFGSAFKGFANLGDNPTVFAVVTTILFVYFIMMFWARRKDKRDAIKVSLVLQAIKFFLNKTIFF